MNIDKMLNNIIGKNSIGRGIVGDRFSHNVTVLGRLVDTKLRQEHQRQAAYSLPHTRKRIGQEKEYLRKIKNELTNLPQDKKSKKYRLMKKLDSTKELIGSLQKYHESDIQKYKQAPYDSKTHTNKVFYEKPITQEEYHKQHINIASKKKYYKGLLISERIMGVLRRDLGTDKPITNKKQITIKEEPRFYTVNEQPINIKDIRTHGEKHPFIIPDKTLKTNIAVGYNQYLQNFLIRKYSRGKVRRDLKRAILEHGTEGFPTYHMARKDDWHKGFPPYKQRNVYMDKNIINEPDGPITVSKEPIRRIPSYDAPEFDIKTSNTGDYWRVRKEMEPYDIGTHEDRIENLENKGLIKPYEKDKFYVISEETTKITEPKEKKAPTSDETTKQYKILPIIDLRLYK